MLPALKNIFSPLLFQKRFGPLFCTQFLGAFNDNLLRFSIIIFLLINIYDGDPENSRLLVATTGAIFILPFFLFSSLAGEIADKVEKSNLIQRIKSIEILIATVASIGFVLSNYYLLLFALFLMGAQSTFFAPLKYALLPQHLKENELTSGNAILQTGTYVAIITGTVLGGFLAGLGESATKFLTVYVLLLACLGRFSAHFIPFAKANDQRIEISKNLPLATISLVKNAFSDRLNLILIFLISGFWFTSSVYVAATPTYAKLLLNADANIVTIFNIAFVLGIGTGAFICTILSRSNIKLYLILSGAIGVSLISVHVFWLGVPTTPLVPMTLENVMTSDSAIAFFIDLILIGMFGAIYVIPLYACLQVNLKSTHRARIIAALNVSNALFMVFSAVFCVIAYKYGANEPQLFGLVGMMNFVIILAIYPALKKRWVTLLRERQFKFLKK